ncbi:MAG: endonuclease [candidate division SR1 bacterium]|nr:MAG: endonuclease [candidate division SR1 bacterium]
MEEQNYIQYNRSNLDRARYNRRNPTIAEQKIRKEILCRDKTGYRFLRQKMIDSFIVDFYCSKLLLVIEIDGDSHDGKEIYDLQRTDKLKNKGLMLIRYSNEEILNHIDEVKQHLSEQIEQRKKQLARW